MKPHSEASERNREPILGVLIRVLAASSLVLEVGSGTGQHAAWFAPRLPHLVWQPSDQKENLAGIRQWVEEAGAPNLRQPIELDVDAVWPQVDADAAYSANTSHIMSWPQVQRMFEGVGSMKLVTRFCLYGPFSYAGRHTSDSNARFDAMLRARDPLSGLRDFEAVAELAKAQSFTLEEDIAMPANNRLLVFRR